MPIIEVESDWRQTGITCPYCIGEWMTYSDGKSRPACCNCYKVLPDEFIWEWLITLPEFRPTKHALDGGESAPLEAESTPEVLSTLQAASTPTRRK
jgi:hypothetical protein